MVRIKHRYLTIHILYPEPEKATSSSSKTANSLPQAVIYHRPTPAGITQVHILRLIRDQIAELFGDYGAGMCGGSLQGIFFSFYCKITKLLIFIDFFGEKRV
jgi:ribonuclease P/MRP protein subunit POP5